MPTRLEQMDRMTNRLIDLLFVPTPAWGPLPQTTKSKIHDIMLNAFVGVQDGMLYEKQMYFVSLADQFLTITPSLLVDTLISSYWGTGPLAAVVWGHQIWDDWGDCYMEPGDNYYDCGQDQFMVALRNRQKAFIPISSEPYMQHSMITGANTVENIAPTSAQSQVVASPYAPDQQTAQVVTMPAYIPAAPLPNTGMLPTSATPVGIVTKDAGAFSSGSPSPAMLTSLPMTTPSVAATGAEGQSQESVNGGMGLTLLAIAAFAVLSKRKRN